MCSATPALARPSLHPDPEQVLTTAEELGACLGAAEALVLVCDSAPLEDGALSTLFNNAGDDLRRIVLLSKTVLTRTSWGLGTERTGYVYQPRACCMYRRHRAAAAPRYVHRTRFSLGRAVRTA